MTSRTSNNLLRPEDVLDISFEDASRLRLTINQRVRIRSRYGETTLSVRLGDSVKPGELFATFHTPDVFLNRVTSPHRDHHVGTPEYKVTAVRIEKL
jgi:formate dehydrogenase major subunit